jgi:hypothetical protein
VLEDALGGRPRPEELGPDDAGRLRLAGAYADLLEAAGETERAAEWAAVVAAAEPDDDDVEFTEEELAAEPPADEQPPAPPEEDADDTDAASEHEELDLSDDIEAEVAELLGEAAPPEDDAQR